MKGLILDYNSSEAFVLMEDDSVNIVPINSLPSLLPIGSHINLSSIYSSSNNLKYRPISKSEDFF